MKGERKTGYVIAFALLASFVCHLAIHRHFERRTRLSGMRFESSSSLSSSPDSPLFVPRLELSDVHSPMMPRILDENHLPGRIVPALDVQGENSCEVARQIAEPPTAVAAPTDAMPVETPAVAENSEATAESQGVREVIEQELAHATREERDIWYEELKSLPAGVVRDLLQVRKQIHALPRILGGMPEKLASADPVAAPRHHELPAEPASQKIRFSQPESPSATALEDAVAQLRHNLTNAATPGYKRLRVTLSDLYTTWNDESSRDESPAESPRPRIRGAGCQLGPVLLDLRQGAIHKTSRPLDLAIDGQGFFSVRRGEKEFLTRCGSFTLDRDRQICLVLGDELATLQPVIRVPDDVLEIHVSATGSVTMLKPGDDALTAIGQIHLARIASPALLQPIGGSMFTTTIHSGEAVPGIPGAHALGELQQGCLEQSNVDFERELEEIDQLTVILKSVPTPAARSATARNSVPAPTR